ncbi:deazaflavin-dependent oxidoreductase, nitroreductase family [Sinosporangium album]|uniref:Deazaflavin-dependent oxidoreductase, nitroreductase family n=1 Tax=Sinosporangium album TaxID=504805 RepID=A0A1G8IB21_9ACTN|nr:nitroreductase family deazaflavin-dependent oxidoreductase [Sinosporangium album]SDI16189.1 deazaflavin-dependent oxidoreductase, nitroreductase family [Sinosporangium album]
MLFGEEHVKRYRETGGAEGHDWNDSTVLLLTTTGRRSGEPRTSPLIYQRHGDDLVVIASNGGDVKHPLWYLNLEADPDVEVQVRDEVFPARARAATDAERPELWKLMTATWPPYDEYARKTARKIPVVVLERR